MSGETDRTGFDDADGPVAGRLDGLVPQWLARRAVDVSVSTDRDRYDAGEPVLLAVRLRNRLPVPVTVRTPTRRLWDWSVDGMVGASEGGRPASDGRRPSGTAPGRIRFRPAGTRRIVRRWSGLIERTDADGGRRWVEPAAGDHEVAAFLAVDGPDRPEDGTTIRIG